MKVSRHAKIIELINKYHIETQEELADYLNQEGFTVTQATVSRDIRDLIRSKYTAVGAIYGIRLVLSIVVMMAVSALFLYALKIGECEFPFDTFYPGLLAGMVFLGGLGLLSYALCDNVVVGYMMPLLFYIVSMASGEKYLGKFYLFSMGTGSYEEKWYLALAGMLFLGVGIAVRSRKES